MPRKTITVCLEDGCPELTDDTRCQAHQREHQRQRSASKGPHRRRKRTYTTGDPRWRRLRARILRHEPDCRTCGRQATDVDHINGDATDNHPDNLQPLCGRCHRHKTTTIDQTRDESGRWTRSDEPETPPHGSGSVPLG